MLVLKTRQMANGQHYTMATGLNTGPECLPDNRCDKVCKESLMQKISMNLEVSEQPKGFCFVTEMQNSELSKVNNGLVESHGGIGEG